MQRKVNNNGEKKSPLFAENIVNYCNLCYLVDPLNKAQYLFEFILLQYFLNLNLYIGSNKVYNVSSFKTKSYFHCSYRIINTVKYSRQEFWHCPKLQGSQGSSTSSGGGRETG